MEKLNIVDFCNDLTHNQLLEITTSSLCTILQTDSLLNDLPTDITLEEVNAQIAVQYGQSITVSILREQETPLPVIIPQNGSTVLSLKKAIRRHFEIYQKRTKNSNIKISWKYIWKVYNLEYDGQILDDDNELIFNYGISNKSEIKFIKKKHKKKTY